MVANPLQGKKVLIFPLPLHNLAQPSALTAPFAAPLGLFLGKQDANRPLLNRRCPRLLSHAQSVGWTLS